MEKFGFLAVIIVWGGLLYFLFINGPIASNFGSANFLSSVIASLNANSQSQGKAIGISDSRGNFQKTEIHFNQSVDIFDIETAKNALDNVPLIFAGSNRGLFISRDNGLNWHNFSDVEHKINSDSQVYKILFNPVSPSEGFISVFYADKGAIYGSRDNFFSLEKIFEVDGEAVYDFDINGQNLILGLSNGKLISYSLAKDTSRVLTTLNSPIKELKVFNNGGLIYLTLKSGGFYVSANAGQSFERMTFLDKYSGANKIHNFEASALDNSLVYASTDYGLIRSSDGGRTWQVFRSMPTEKQAISAVSFKDNPGEIFTACNGKIYISLDYGSNWQTINMEINGRIISVIKSIGDKIIVGTKY